MPCFNSIRKKITCLLNDSESAITELILRRRMGVNATGGIILKDIFGEPLNVTGSLYNDLEIPVTIKKAKVENNDDSKIGGIDYAGRKGLEVIASLTVDILRNDLLEYPINSGDWFRVTSKEIQSGTYYKILAIIENRSQS